MSERLHYKDTEVFLGLQGVLIKFKLVSRVPPYEDFQKWIEGLYEYGHKRKKR